MPARTRKPKHTAHDRLFKEFFHRFLPEFVTMFFAKEAARLNFATLDFSDKELIINLPGQKVRISDIIAEVKTWQGEPETIIIHIEVEGRRKKPLPQRMFEYYSLLRILRRKPVLPIALLLRWKADGVSWETYTETLLEQNLINFRFGQVGIRGLSSMAYLKQNMPVAAALAVLMNSENESQAAIKLAALRVIIDSAINSGDKLFLMEFINTYLPTIELTDHTEEVMKQITTIEATWGDRLRIEGEQAMLLRLLALMFGPLPENTIKRVRAITDEAQLDVLAQQMLKAKQLDEIQLLDQGDLTPS